MTQKVEVRMVSDASQAIKDQQALIRKVDDLSKSHQKAGRVSVKAAKEATGSFARLERELKDNLAALKRMEVGSREFERQKRKVDELATSLGKAKRELAAGNAAAGNGKRIVAGFISEVGAVAGGIASVGAIIQAVRTDLENLKKSRENQRLANVQFGQAEAAALGNLPEDERADLRPVALELADNLGLPPGGIAEVLGALRSSGAEDVREAGRFLLEAGKAFPQDLAGASEIAKAALIEARATGNRDAAQSIGSLLQAQAVSQVTSGREFAQAFSSNIASAIKNQGFSAEQAREEAAIFSVLETKSAEVAATAQQAFFTQVQKFVPEIEAKLKDGSVLRVDEAERKKFIEASVPERINLLEGGGDLLKQFEDRLQDTGRGAITRRLRQSGEDRETFDAIRGRVTNPQDAAKEFGVLQKQSQDAALFAINEGRRIAQSQTVELRKEMEAAVIAEVNETFDAVQAQRIPGVGGFAQRYLLEGPGFYVERAATRTAAAFGAMEDQGPTAATLEALRFQAKSEESEVIRQFIEQQIERLERLIEATDRNGVLIQRQNQLAEEQGVPKVQEVKMANAEPVEAPPAAANVP